MTCNVSNFFMMQEFYLLNFELKAFFFSSFALLSKEILRILSVQWLSTLVIPCKSWFVLFNLYIISVSSNFEAAMDEFKCDLNLVVHCTLTMEHKLYFAPGQIINNMIIQNFLLKKILMSLDFKFLLSKRKLCMCVCTWTVPQF